METLLGLIILIFRQCICIQCFNFKSLPSRYTEVILDHQIGKTLSVYQYDMVRMRVILSLL